MGFSEPVLIGWCGWRTFFVKGKEGSNQGKQHQAKGFPFFPKERVENVRKGLMFMIHEKYSLDDVYSQL